MNAPVSNTLTVDVESWCHASTEEFSTLPPAEQHAGIRRGMDPILSLLRDRGYRATFFILGSVAELCPEIVLQVRDAGHEIGSHGYLHHRVDALTPREFSADLRRAREILEPLSGRPVTAYRAPMWSLYRVRRWAMEVLVQEGFRYDSSLFPIRVAGHPRLPKRPYDIRTPSGTLTEVPPLTARGLLTRYPLGGTWGFRTLPYRRIRRAVLRSNRRGDPALFHLHPWEFDADRPALRQPLLTKLALTIRLTNLRQRTDLLLSEFPFAPLSEVAHVHDRPVYDIKDLP